MPPEDPTGNNQEEGRYLADNEVLDAIASMPPGDWNKLVYWSRKMWPRDPYQLYDEVFNRVDPRRRDAKKRPRRLRRDRPTVVGLYGVMRSIRHEFAMAGSEQVLLVSENEDRIKGSMIEAEAAASEPPTIAQIDQAELAALQEAEEEGFLEYFNAALEARIIEAKAADDRKVQEQLERFSDRAIVQKVMEGIRKGLRGKDLCEFSQVDKDQLATIRQMIRRRKAPESQ